VCSPLGSNIADACEVCLAARPRLRVCYDQALPKYPDMQGAVMLTLRIEADGRVSAVSGGVGGSLDPIVACLKDVARSLVFAPPDHGEAIVTFPLTYIREH
jgi:hypothetical protein